MNAFLCIDLFSIIFLEQIPMTGITGSKNKILYGPCCFPEDQELMHGATGNDLILTPALEPSSLLLVNAQQRTNAQGRNAGRDLLKHSPGAAVSLSSLHRCTKPIPLALDGGCLCER